MKHILLLAVCFLSTFANAQILTFDSIASENKIINFQNQKLIMIDFWATWCAPCMITWMIKVAPT